MEPFDATRAHAESVIRWLKHEHFNDLEGASGFYCNRKIIREAAKESRMKCLRIKNSIAGFVVFTIFKKHSVIEILEIRPKFREKGLGRILAVHVVDSLFSKGAAYIKVECSPHSSEQFWRKIGFVDDETSSKSTFGNPKLILGSKPDKVTSYAPSAPDVAEPRLL